MWVVFMDCLTSFISFFLYDPLVFGHLWQPIFTIETENNNNSEIPENKYIKLRKMGTVSQN